MSTPPLSPDEKVYRVFVLDKDPKEAIRILTIDQATKDRLHIDVSLIRVADPQECDVFLVADPTTYKKEYGGNPVLSVSKPVIVATGYNSLNPKTAGSPFVVYANGTYQGIATAIIASMQNYYRLVVRPMRQLKKLKALVPASLGANPTIQQLLQQEPFLVQLKEARNGLGSKQFSNYITNKLRDIKI